MDGIRHAAFASTGSTAEHLTTRWVVGKILPETNSKFFAWKWMVGEFAYFQGLCKWGICKNSLKERGMEIWYSKISLDTFLTEIGQTSFVPNQYSIEPWIATYQVLAWRMHGILAGIHTLNLKNLLCQCESNGQHGALKESLVSMSSSSKSLLANWELWFNMPFSRQTNPGMGGPLLMHLLLVIGIFHVEPGGNLWTSRMLRTSLSRETLNISSLKLIKIVTGFLKCRPT